MSRKGDRLYWRDGRGWYMDLRDVGGGQKACIPEGKRGATKDRDEASKILAARLEEIEAGREDREDPRLREYAKRHLRVKAQTRRESTVSRDERALRIVLDYFGKDVRLSEIDVAGLTDYVTHRRQQPGVKKGTTISASTILKELNALSSLYKRAVAERKAKVNPVRRLPEKPSAKKDQAEAAWLEPGEAAELLKKAGKEDEDRHPRAVPFLRPLLATFLLTGGRKQEVFGLLRRDVDFEDGIVHFRPNVHRRLKNGKHRRHLPLWPQLRKILTEYLEDFDRESDELLFPSPNGGMISDIRGSLGNAVEAAKIEKRVTLHTFRHTYAATRIQTTDRGEPVSMYTVMRELGHSSLKLIEETYGHLQNTRSRSPVVEYRKAEVVDIESARKGEARTA